MVKKIIALIIYFMAMLATICIGLLANYFKINISVLGFFYFLILFWIVFSIWVPINKTANATALLLFLIFGAILKLLSFTFISEIFFRIFFVILIVYLIQSIINLKKEK